MVNIHWITEKAREFQKSVYFCFIDCAKAFDCVDHKKLWKNLKEKGIPDHLTRLLRNLYAGQKATVRTRHGTTDWFQVGKEVCQDCILSPCLFNLYAEYIMKNAGLEEAQAGIKIAGRNINNFRCADVTTLMAESEEELKIHLMKVKEESEKVLNFGIQKTNIMGPAPVTSWQIDGDTVETVSDFIFGGSKISADGDCSHEIKRHLLFGRKVMTNLDNILKSRDITLSTTVHLVKAMVFPVVMYVCESWTIKKAEHWRIDAFGLWCWRRLFRVPWTARKSNQSILKEIRPEYSLERLMWSWNSNTLASWCGELTHWKRHWFWGSLWQKEKGTTEHGMVGWHHQLNVHEFGWTPGVGDGQGGLAWCSPWGRKELDTTEQLNWT